MKAIDHYAMKLGKLPHVEAFGRDLVSEQDAIECMACDRIKLGVAS